MLALLPRNAKISRSVCMALHRMRVGGGILQTALPFGYCRAASETPKKQEKKRKGKKKDKYKKPYFKDKENNALCQ
jgi:hypothetical protein